MNDAIKSLAKAQDKPVYDTRATMPSEREESMVSLKRRLCRLVQSELARGPNDRRSAEEDEELAAIDAALIAAHQRRLTQCSR